MTTILGLDSTMNGEASVSKALLRAAVTAPTDGALAQVTTRDLGREPVPHLTEATARGVRAESESPDEFAARALSDALLAELREADTIVIGAPMYNFIIPTSLRSWFDHILRAGETFRYTDAGPKGLLGDKKVIVAESRGGLKAKVPRRPRTSRSRTCASASSA